MNHIWHQMVEIESHNLQHSDSSIMLIQSEALEQQILVQPLIQRHWPSNGSPMLAIDENNNLFVLSCHLQHPQILNKKLLLVKHNLLSNYLIIHQR